MHPQGIGIDCPVMLLIDYAWVLDIFISSHEVPEIVQFLWP